MSFFAELKRRNVVKVGIAYVVASWLLLQLTDVLTELLELNTDVGKIVILLLIIGFIPALIFAWAFEMTPEGIKREADVDRTQSIAPHTGRKLDFVIIGMLVLIAGYFIWESRFKQDEQSSAVATTSESTDPAITVTEPPNESAEKSIVVLPFVNMSNDPDQEFFSDGLSEEILNALVKISDLRVISRTSAFAFKGKDMAIPEIAEQLNVSHVLEGSVRKAGNDVRITAQLIEVDTDSHLWSEAYSRTLENVFEIQEEISTAIAGQLQLRLSDAAATERPTDSAEAYQLFLRGRHHYQARGAENMRQATALFEQALELDPEFDEAWANLGASLLIESYYTNEGVRMIADRSDKATQQAIAINPSNGLAHAVMGLWAYAELDFEKALSELDLAISLSPNESNAYLWKAITLSSLGYVEQAADVLQSAVAIDPVFTNLHNWLVTAYLSTGDYEAARHHQALLLSLDPEAIFNDQGDLELIAGDMDAFEAAVMRQAIEEPATEPLLRAYIAAMRDPAQKDQLIATLDNWENDVWVVDAFAYYLRIGETEKALLALNEDFASYRTLRGANVINYLWRAKLRPQLAHPGVLALFDEFGVVDYWRKHGDPDFCRVTDDGVECDVE